MLTARPPASFNLISYLPLTARNQSYSLQTPNMNSIKCKNCGLSNFPDDVECRRCGFSFLRSTKKKERSPSPVSVWTLLMLAILGGLAYYVINGTQESIDQVTADQMKQATTRPAERPIAPGLSRSEYDRQKTQTYSDAVRNSQSIADHNKHIQQTEKVMQQISNGK